MKKIFLVGLLASFLIAGTAIASTVKIINTNDYFNTKGEIITSFTDPDIDSSWSYCVDKSISIYFDVAYDFSLVDVANYTSSDSTKGYSAAWLIYDAYNYSGNPAGDTPTVAAQQALQENIWDVFENNTSYFSYYNGKETTLSNLFDIVITTPVNGSDIQNLIIHNSSPVPEPATLLLLGFGLLGIAGVSRRKN